MNQFNPGEFVKAVQQNNERMVNQNIVFLSKRLISFLTQYCSAPTADAKDCSQEAFYKTLQTIRENRIRDHHKIYPYLKRAALNNYFKLVNKYKRTCCVAPSEKNYFSKTLPNHHYDLIEKEFFNQFILSIQCLSPKHRDCIDYWLTYPDHTSRELADNFDISLSNAYTRKSRAIVKVNEEMQQHQAIRDLSPELKAKLYKRLPELYKSYKARESSSI